MDIYFGDGKLPVGANRVAPQFSLDSTFLLI